MRVKTSAVLAVMVAATLASGCSRIKSTQGYIVDEQLVAAIQPGVDNRTSVQRTLGRPTFISQFDSREWFYVSRNTTQLAFLNPRPKTQQILTVTFDANGNVAKVEKRGLEQVVSVTPVGDTTPTLGRNESLFTDLFGNIGQFGAGGPGGVGSDQGGTGRDGPR